MYFAMAAWRDWMACRATKNTVETRHAGAAPTLWRASPNFNKRSQVADRAVRTVPAVGGYSAALRASAEARMARMLAA